MSWQAYVDTQLIATQQVEQALIAGRDGSLWAATEGFALSTYNVDQYNDAGEVTGQVPFDEAANLAAAVGAGSFSNGCRIAGTKYMVVNTNTDGAQPIFYLKKPKGGACVAATNQGIIVGTWNQEAGHTPGGCNGAVEALATYLIDAGF